MAFTTLMRRQRPDLTGRHVVRHNFVAPPPERRAPFAHKPFAPLQKRADLISLAEAQNTPHIVYHSVPAVQGRPEGYAFSLVPLSIAAARDDIRLREEGFEIEEHRMWL